MMLTKGNKWDVFNSCICFSLRHPRRQCWTPAALTSTLIWYLVLSCYKQIYYSRWWTVQSRCHLAILEGLFVGICLCWINYCSFQTDVLGHQRDLSSELKLEWDVFRSQVVAVLCSLGFLLEINTTQPVTSESTSIWCYWQKFRWVSRNTIYSGVFYLFLFVQVTEGIKHDAEWDFRVFTYLIWNVLKLLGSGQWVVVWYCDETHKCGLPLHKESDQTTNQNLLWVISCFSHIFNFHSL